MSETSFLVVTALAEERAAVERALRRRTWHPTAPGRYELGHRRIALACTGPGASAARLSADEALDANESPRGLLGVGLCGALSPSLEAGDLVVADRVQNVAVPGEDTRLEAPLRGPEELSGVIACSSRLINEPEERASLWREIDAPLRAAVDLESFAWAQAALEHQVPWAIVRSVSDGASDPLPRAVVAAMSESGAVDRTKVLGHVLRHPTEIAALLRLGRRARRAADRAADFALAWVEKGWEQGW
ncbi:MAG: hypothetical protein AAF690_09870 [Acidobacteriota bacterium]